MDPALAPVSYLWPHASFTAKDSRTRYFRTPHQIHPRTPRAPRDLSEPGARRRRAVQRRARCVPPLRHAARSLLVRALPHALPQHHAHLRRPPNPCLWTCLAMCGETLSWLFALSETPARVCTIHRGAHIDLACTPTPLNQTNSASACPRPAHPERRPRLPPRKAQRACIRR